MGWIWTRRLCVLIIACLLILSIVKYLSSPNTEWVPLALAKHIGPKGQDSGVVAKEYGHGLDRNAVSIATGRVLTKNASVLGLPRKQTTRNGKSKAGTRASRIKRGGGLKTKQETKQRVRDVARTTTTVPTSSATSTQKNGSKKNVQKIFRKPSVRARGPATVDHGRPLSRQAMYQNISEYFSVDSGHRDELLNDHKFQYTVESNVCDDQETKLFVLAFVHSAPGNKQQRTAIRKTWGQKKTINGRKIATIFMLAATTNQIAQKQIEAEAGEFGDIVQAQFLDSYRNLTYKHIMALHWVTENCPDVRYVLKTDDDTMVNLYNMVRYLHVTNQTNGFLYCSPYYFHRPIRDMRDKWYVSEKEYPFEFYPGYCEGFAYIITTDVAHRFLNASRNMKYYWVDDLYVTGILNIKAKIKITSFARGHSYENMKKRDTGPEVNNYMFILAKYRHMAEFWNGTWSAIVKFNGGNLNSALSKNHTLKATP